MPLAGLACLGLAFALSSCGGYGRLTDVRQAIPRSAECGGCHVEIFSEWKGSAHAQAYTSATYKKATNNYRREGCLDCHAPQPSWTSADPSVRASAREEGILCVSCHLEDGSPRGAGKMVGPLAPTGLVSPHPVAVNRERYRDPAFCGRCHEAAYHQWQRAGQKDKPTCQQCHMGSVRRRMTQATGCFSGILVAMEKPDLEYRHSITGAPTVLPPAPPASKGPSPQTQPASETAPSLPVSVTARYQGAQIELIVTNRLPHALPTGDYGVRVCEVLVEAGAKVLGRRELSVEEDTAIPAGGQLRWRLDPPPGTDKPARLRVRLRQLQADDTRREWLSFEVVLP